MIVDFASGELGILFLNSTLHAQTQPPTLIEASIMTIAYNARSSAGDPEISIFMRSG
jgi:hypothetical protein